MFEPWDFKGELIENFGHFIFHPSDSVTDCADNIPNASEKCPDARAQVFAFFRYIHNTSQQQGYTSQSPGHNSRRRPASSCYYATYIGLFSQGNYPSQCLTPHQYFLCYFGFLHAVKPRGRVLKFPQWSCQPGRLLVTMVSLELSLRPCRDLARRSIFAAALPELERICISNESMAVDMESHPSPKRKKAPLIR